MKKTMAWTFDWDNRLEYDLSSGEIQITVPADDQAEPLNIKFQELQGLIDALTDIIEMEEARRARKGIVT